MERNPIGRYLFKIIGVKNGILVVGFITIVVVLVVAFSVYKYNNYFYTILFTLVSVFISWIQYSVAISNYTKKPTWIVQQIQKLRFYKYF